MLKHLTAQDPDLSRMIRDEVRRQQDSLELIASENIVSEAVLEALGTPLTNKYSEGYPGRRYYGGNRHVDEVEILAIERAKTLFGAEHANVQPHAGSQANLAAYLGLAEQGSTIMAMDLAMGGHLTHGSPVNFSGKLFKFVHYGVRKDTHLIDMDEVRAIALEAKPKIIVAGFTAYPRTLDFAAFRKIADEVGAFLLVDMAHFAGLVAGKAFPDPVPYADVITTTTHKTLRGPRGAMILCRQDFAKKIDSAVFPGMQGGPLEHVIAAKAVAFGEALRPEFAAYQAQVIRNARALGAALIENGLTVVTGGTDNHMLLADLTALGITGKPAVEALDAVGIATNMNMIPYDPRKPVDPSGLRLGTPALTTRGFGEEEMRNVGLLIAQILKHPDDHAIHEDVQRVVAKLCEAHPIYPEWKA
jgi:glycine hydroxymethyltransferase